VADVPSGLSLTPSEETKLLVPILGSRTYELHIIRNQDTRALGVQTVRSVKEENFVLMVFKLLSYWYDSEGKLAH
jgi:hypothetical protein